MTKLEKLTPEQEELKKVIAKKWIDLSINNGRKITVPEVRSGIDWIYKKANLKSPLIIITPSPYYAQLTANYIKNIKPNILSELIKNFKIGKIVWANVRANVWDNVRDNVWANVRANVWDNVRDNVWDNVRANVGANVRANVWDNVRANVGDNVWDNVWDNVRANVGDNVWDNVRANVGDNVWDNVGDNVGDNEIKLEFFSVYNGLDFSSGWISFYDYFETIGIIQHKEFETYRDVFAKGIWNCILFENVCIISETPTSVLKNERGRLHSVTKPAVQFKDGYSCYYIHGVRFDYDLWKKVTERKLSPKQLLELKNTDQRFVSLNHYGFEKALSELNPVLIDKSKRGNRLYKIKFDQTELEYLLYPDTVSGNPRVSFVKPGFNDADMAMAWKHRMTKEQYMKLETEA